MKTALLKRMRTSPCILLPLLVMGTILRAEAEQPTALVRASTDRILALLADSALNTPAGKSERRQLIAKELDQLIDWDIIARSSLGRHWAKSTAAEHAEFVTVFHHFLEETCVDRFETHYPELDKLEYLGEKIVDDYASVKAQLTTKDQIVHPVEFRLRKSGQEWRVYDLVLEGVSLVKNYRDQFDEILSKSSFPALLADLRAKTPGGGA